MVRKSPIASPREDTAAEPSTGLGAFDFLPASAPLIAAWYDSCARMVAVIQRAETSRAATLTTLAASLHEIGLLASTARGPQDLTAVATRLQQMLMEMGSVRQEDLTRSWIEVQDEAAQLVRSLANHQLPAPGPVAGARRPNAPVAMLMEQAQASFDQWMRDWTAVTKTSDAVQ